MSKKKEPNNTISIKGLPKPQNGRIYGKIIKVEQVTQGGIIMPEIGHTTTRMDLRDKDILVQSKAALILEVMDLADKLDRIKLEKGQLIMIDPSFRDRETTIGEFSIIILHEMDVLGIWDKQ